VLGLLVTAISWLSLTGYLFGADTLYTLPRATAIALQTALMLLSVGLALVFSVPHAEPVRTLTERSAAGIFARRALPILVLFTTLAGYARLQGEFAGLYDVAMGTALLVLTLTVVLCATLWWAVRAVGEHERAVDASRSALLESEHRVAQMLETNADGFVSLDREWRFTYINSAAERMLRRPRPELIGRNLWDVFPELVGSRVHTALQTSAASRVTIDVEDRNPISGQTFWNRAYPTADGGVSVHFRDITDRKQAEETLRQADRRKDEFLATLAHELRNPLAPLRNSLELVKRLKDRPDLSGKALDMMERQVKTMVRLIDDLLDVSRITRDRLELRREHVDLASVVHHAVEACRPQASMAGHQLTVELPSEPIRLHADPTRLAQVLGNLLNNACKYTDPGGVIRLSAARDGQDAVITVSDSGVGISSGMLPLVFDLFVQADRPLERRGDGLGIGLSLVKRLVELHGGSVSAHSDGPGQGSRFTLRLPISGESREDATPRPGTEMSGAAPCRRILVVDDNKDSAESLSLLLRAAGHDSRVAYDGEQALEEAVSFRPEVILLDIGLPGMDGYATCRKIREQPWGRSVIVAAVTGWGQEEDRRRSSEAGFQAHFVKPVDVGALTGLLASAGVEQPAG
jgi:PAS domain S-box-containing protein